ncbi:MAG: 2-amino-4-hydroxy-6-hydroxymethyldihydropteridine diphosphokinase [Treponema sp.]|nr:2-amino-4-hydroxy-6-hydroxymethyldihydropteridine diphosphokinase [Treponema sp.]
MTKDCFDNTQVILGLGSNRPWNGLDSFSILAGAISELSKNLVNIKRASFYETEPIPKSSQNNFINTAAAGLFNGSPGKLLNLVNNIEAQFGRDRSKEIRWGERSLDIDILLFGDLALTAPDLVIPHPRLEERRFALEPLLELWPSACSPVTGKLYREICDALPEQGVCLLTC